MAVKDTLKKVGKAIAWPFVYLFKALFSARGRKALALAYQQMLQTPLGKIIVQIVAEVADLGLAGPEAQQAAFQRITAAAQQAKLEWKASLINLGIELAVQALKGNI